MQNGLLKRYKDLFSWGHRIHSRFKEYIKSCKDKLKFLRYNSDSNSLREFKISRDELILILPQEEAFWRQHVKLFWTRDGDANRKCYCKHQEKKNLISKLSSDNKVVVTNMKDLCLLEIYYFETLFACDEVGIHANVENVHIKNSLDDNSFLLLLLKSGNLKFEMHSHKFAGPYGFNPVFYKRFWDLIGDDIYLNDVAWLNQVFFPPNLNSTYIAMIPKIGNPSSMKDLRPMSLFSVTTKKIAFYDTIFTTVIRQPL